MDNWNELCYRAKLLILEGESTVMVELLLENDDFVAMLKQGKSKQECLDFINENW